MATRSKLAEKYNKQYADLHEQYFVTLNQGTPQQERVLKERKAATELNIQYTQITDNYEAELKANGFEELPPEPEMDYKAEILKLQDEIKKLKEKG